MSTSSIEDVSKPEQLDQTALLAAIVESSRDAIVSKDLNGIVTSWNRGAQMVFGYTAEEMIGTSILKLIPPDKAHEEDAIISKIKSGERIDHYETVRRRKDGELIHVSLTISPIRGQGGRIVGASKIARDVTDRYRTAETQRLLMRELNHRSKNLLAVVEAMVRKTASSTPPHELVARISQRLQALSSIQNLLIYSDWQGVDMSSLVRAQLKPFPEERIKVQGPYLVLQPAAAQAIGLALHELVTNAARYGSLSSEKGDVLLVWSVFDDEDGSRCFRMEWSETGGPPIQPPSATAFGTTILQRATSDALEGKVKSDYLAGGLNWVLTAPHAHVSV